MLIEQGLGGDIVYISSKNSVFAGPNNIAYSRGQGRPGPPGAAARRRARRARHQGQRRQPRRRRRRAPASSPAAGAPSGPRSTACEEEDLGEFYAQRTLLKREVLPEHVANAVFALFGPRPDATPPACTSRSTPASPPRSCAERRRPCGVAAVDLGASSGRVMVGRGRARTRSRLEEVHRFPNGAVRTATARCTGTSLGAVPRGAASGCARRPRAAGRCDGIGIDSWAVDYGLLDADGAAARRPRRLPRRPHRRRSSRRCTRPVGAERAVRRQRPAAPAVQHALPAGRGARAPLRSTRPTLLLLPDLLGYWLTGELRRRAHQRLDHRAARRAHRGRGPTELLDAARPARRRCCRRCVEPGRRRSARCCREVAARTRAAAGDAASIAVGSHDTASAVVGVPATERPASPTSPRGTWSLVGLELDAAGAHRGGPRGQLHQRGRRRRHGPLPAQRDGPVAAQRVPARLGAEDADRPGGAARRGRRPCRRRCRSSTSTTRGSCRPGDMPARIAALRAPSTAGAARRRRPTIVRCILDSLAAGLPPRAVRRGRRPRRAHGRRRARRRRRRAERPALPADRRRAAACRCWPARSRRPRSATCWSRPAPLGADRARPRGDARRWSRAPTTLRALRAAAASTGTRPRPRRAGEA